MLSLLPLFACTSLTAPTIEQDDWNVLGEIQAFGQTDSDGRMSPARKVPIKFPKDFVAPVDPLGPGFDYAGGKVLLNEWGNLGHVHWGQGGWGELRELYVKAQEKIGAGSAVPWKVKAILFTRTDLLHEDKNGVLIPQDNVLFETDINLILESFARMEAFIEAYSMGAVDVQTSFTFEREPVVGVHKLDVFNFSPLAAGNSYYRGRFNRGEFDSVMYFYVGAEAEAPSFGSTMGRTNGATQSQILYANGRENGARIGHTEELVRQFLQQVRQTAATWGYGTGYDPLLPPVENNPRSAYSPNSMGFSGDFGYLRDYARFAITPGLWAKARNRVEPDYVAAFNQTKTFDGTLRRWTDVADDPWAGLPLVNQGDIARRIGADNVGIHESAHHILWLPSSGDYRTPIKTRIDFGDITLNNQLNPAREGLARIGYGDRDLIIVRLDLADFVIRHLGDHAAGADPPANVMGITKGAGDRLYVVLDTKLSNDTLSEVNLLSARNERSGLVVMTKGVFATREPISLKFGAEVPEARFSITDDQGTGLTLTNGTLDLANTSAGVHVLRATAALPSGERIERPFVIRVVDPVSIDKLQYTRGELRMTLSNHGPAREAAIDVQLPAGWSTEDALRTITLNANETSIISTRVVIPEAAAAGPAGITVSATVPGHSPSTARVSVTHSTAQDLVHHTFETGTDGWDAARWDRGGWTVASEDGGGTGRSLAVRDAGGVRWGKVTALGRYLDGGRPDPKFQGYEASDYPWVTFSAKSDGKTPLALTFIANGLRCIAMITGDVEPHPSIRLLPRVHFVPDGTWQSVSYNLAAALGGAGVAQFITDIAFGDPRQFVENQYHSDKIQTHWIDEFKISKAAVQTNVPEDTDAELTPVGSVTSTDPYLRALGAAKAQGTPEELAGLRAMLRDVDNVARLNAAAAFARIKDPEAIPALIEVGKMERVPYPAMMFVRALAFQDTPETWAAVQAIVRQGRAEELSLAEAARLMGEKKDPKFVESLSILITAKSWMARREGALGMAAIPTDPGAQMLMTFLLEVDPMVRLAVGQVARVDIDPVGRRMEWGSINDLSSVVRAYNYAALTRSVDPLLRSRGYAGLKETDTDIRRIIAEQLELNPHESHVSHLLGLLSDASPEVRAAAVTSLFRMPGARTFSEMSVIAGENYDAVLYPLLDAARAGKIELPRAMLERLSTHRNPLIRDTVKELIR
ncbi:MAG: hypothetical protein M3R13_10660 [Armatimonadota bacterium]|nr:hypothetical protein [Armatimonadota bacterium]